MIKKASKVFSLDHLLDRDWKCGVIQVAKYGHVGWGGGGGTMVSCVM